MSMSQSLSLRQGLCLSQSLSHSFGETSGDIPVYSLHKVSHLLKKKPIGISRDLEKILNQSLLAANAEYKEDSGNDWNCLTSNCLVSAIEAVETAVREINEAAISSLPKEQSVQAKVCGEFFAKKRTECMTTIKKWFEVNYDILLYDMSGKIPWAVVVKLRRNLGLWIMGSTNPFQQDIEEMVIEVAAENNITGATAEEAWEALGGKLFTEES